MKGYAVIDLETSGKRWGNKAKKKLGPHRVLEIGVVLTDPEGYMDQTWETLVRPRGDIPEEATDYHGISVSDVQGAPYFEDVAGHLLSLIQGRIPVAHNSSFDASFLWAEFYRMKIDSKVLDYKFFKCTKTGFEKAYPGLTTTTIDAKGETKKAYTLQSLCAHFNVDYDIHEAHSALHDAKSTQALLLELLKKEEDVDYRYVPLLDASAWPTVEVKVTKEFTRDDGRNHKPDHYLAQLQTRLPNIDTNSEEAKEYLEYLDKCLLDRFLAQHEHKNLAKIANGIGISQEMAEILNRRYLRALAEAAWENDRDIDEEEEEELREVVKLLQLTMDDLDTAIQAARHEPRDIDPAPWFTLNPGDGILFSKPARGKEYWTHKATAAGLEVKSGISGRVKVLVVADPDSITTKSGAAAEKMIPIVKEDSFERMLEQLSE